MKKKPAKAGKAAKKEEARKETPKKKPFKINKKVIAYAAVTAVLLIAVVCIVWYIKSVSVSLENTIPKLNALDDKYGIEWKDWQYGFNYLWYHPRYPNPLNTKDIEAAIAEFGKLRDEISSDRASLLMVDARIHILEAERNYRIAKSKPAKNFVDDGFTCADQPYVLEAAGNVNISIFHGKIAISELQELFANHREELKDVDISDYYIKSLNESFSGLAEEMDNNVHTINRFCINGALKPEIRIVNGTVIFTNTTKSNSSKV